MEKIEKVFESIVEDINNSNNGSTKRKTKTLINQLGYKTTKSDKVIELIINGINGNKLIVKPDNSLVKGMSERQYITFYKNDIEEKTNIDKPQSKKAYTNSLETVKVPDDIFKHLFEFEDEEYERFQACLDSNAPMAIFLIPLEKDFYGSVIERLLFLEILRKQQQQQDRTQQQRQSYSKAEFEPNAIVSEWQSADIHSFSKETLESVVLGESATELLESEKFDAKFNQLSLISNRYYAERNDPFFIIFNCPSLEKINAQEKNINLDKLIEKVAEKLPYTFKLIAKYKNDEHLNEDNKIKDLVVKHLQILFESPNYEISSDENLIDIYNELQKVQVHAENIVFNTLENKPFQKLTYGYESQEHIFLKYFAIKTILDAPYNVDFQKVECEESISDTDEGTTNNSRPDVSFEWNGKKIIVEAETIRSKGYLKLVSELLRKAKGWKGAKNFAELWLLVPGFEVARNYYQLHKTKKLLEEQYEILFGKKIVVRIFAPDVVNQKIIEFDVTDVYSLQNKVGSNPKNTSESIVNSIEKVAKNETGFSKVKGLNEEKEALDSLVQLKNLNEKIGIGGILFYGLPGCGKTYLAKAFAQELGWNFYSFSHADLTSQWLGESQQKIRAIFRQAKAQSPSVLFIDELDSIAINRDNDRNSHSDQKATVNQLLVELNNASDSDILVIGATNYISGLDKAFLRTGRFDWKIPIFPPDVEERKEMITYYHEQLVKELAKRGKILDNWPNSQIDDLAEATKCFTSSDIKAIFNQPRIQLLLNKIEAKDFDEVVNKSIESTKNENQLSLTQEQVSHFITDSKLNTDKIGFLKKEWDLE